MRYGKSDCQTLIAQMHKFDLKQALFDQSYIENLDTPLIWWIICKSFSNFLEILAIHIFGIISHSALYERLFSTLS